jgi:hypothetical protein
MRSSTAKLHGWSLMILVSFAACGDRSDSSLDGNALDASSNCPGTNLCVDVGDGALASDAPEGGEDSGRVDSGMLECRGESDCPFTERCAVPLANPTNGNCRRGSTPSEAVCLPQCRAYCIVGPHTLLNPADPEGIVAGFITPDCFGDAGLGD